MTFGEEEEKQVLQDQLDHSLGTAKVVESVGLSINFGCVEGVDVLKQILLSLNESRLSEYTITSHTM
jgi:HKD family nuclease